MDLTATLTIAAIFLGPIVAVRLTRYLDDKKEIRERKIRLFKILMATRGTALSPGHVEALNLIDLEFNPKKKKEKEVIEAWKMYLDHLGTQATSDEQWRIRRMDLFVDLLHRMANVLNYEFDKVHIKNSAYFPRGHGEIEDDQTAIRRGFRELLEMKRIIPMYVTNLPAQNPPEEVEDEALKEAQREVSPGGS
jgi:hypothetical protein